MTQESHIKLQADISFKEEKKEKISFSNLQIIKEKKLAVTFFSSVA